MLFIDQFASVSYRSVFVHMKPSLHRKEAQVEARLHHSPQTFPEWQRDDDRYQPDSDEVPGAIVGKEFVQRTEDDGINRMIAMEELVRRENGSGQVPPHVLILRTYYVESATNVSFGSSTSCCITRPRPA